MFAIILVFVTGLLYYVYQCYQMRNLPPFYKGAWPIIGHSILALTTKNYYILIASIFKDLMEKKADFLTFRLGIWNFHGILNPNDAYLIANSCLQKDALYDYMKPLLGEGLITADVAKWKIHRKFLNPTFNQQILDGYLCEFNNQTRQLVETVAAKAGKGHFDHYNYMSQTILKTVCGSSITSSRHQSEEIFIKQTNTRMRHSEAVEECLLTEESSTRGELKILNKKKIEFLLNKKQIVGKASSETRFKPFLELLLELAEDEKLTDQEISDELNTFIVAGTDTMAITLSNALTCIGTYGAVQDRIFGELEEVFEGSDRDVDKQDLPRLKYLEAVIKETLRLYPTVIAIGRTLEKDINIKGYTFPAGGRCIIFIYGVLRHWTWGPDADTFRPERWLDGSLPKDIKGFAAFGIGKRSCIGANFAIMCIKTVLAGFLRRYSIKSDVTKMVQEFYITSKSISGHEISIEDRRQLGNPSGEL